VTRSTGAVDDSAHAALRTPLRFPAGLSRTDTATPTTTAKEQQMPNISIQTNPSDGDAGHVTLSERVVATHLQDDHYALQLIERLTWAAIDAEQLESPTDRAHPDERRGVQPTRPPRDAVSSRPLTRPVARTRRDST
jgi:hypothetical protein